MKFKKVGLAVLTAVVVAGSQSALAANCNPGVGKTFDEDNIVLSFGAISDIHLKDQEGKDDTYFKNALKLLKQTNKKDIDTLLIAGDVTDTGSDKQIGRFKTLLDENFISGTEVLMLGGNHDIPAFEDGNKFLNGLGDWVYHDIPDTNADSWNTNDDITKGNYHTKVNGYHFINITMKTYAGDSMPEDLEWLKKQLAIAKQDAPDKAIFISEHPSPYDTVYGSHLDDTFANGPGTRWNDAKIADVLKDYPQVVVFGGHTHFPLTAETSIMQDKFTTIGTGAVSYMSVDPFYIDTRGGTELDGSGLVSQGNLVQVDKNGVIRVTRLDFANMRTIRDPWIFETVTDASKFIYTKNRAEGIESPYFEDGAKLDVTMTATKDPVTIEMTFDNAKSGGDIVHYYNVDIHDKEGNLLYENKTFSDFFMHNDTQLESQISKKFRVGETTTGSKGIIPSGVDVVVTVTPYNSFGMAGEPIKVETKTPVRKISTTTSTADNTTELSETNATDDTTVSSTDDTSEQSQQTTEEPTVSNPKTGSASKAVGWISVIAVLAAIAAFTVYGKKKVTAK